MPDEIVTQILCGREVSNKIRAQLKEEIDQISKTLGPHVHLPRLDVIIVGDRDDSALYVRMKTDACAKVGIQSLTHRLPATTTQEELDNLIRELSADPCVSGVLLQLPLPAGLESSQALQNLRWEKDVDGLTEVNMGKLMSMGLEAPLLPCTPLGCVKMLQHYKVDVSGKKALVVGRSLLVGKPMASLLVGMDATVTLAHSKTQDLEALVGAADLVVVAVGKHGTVKGSWLKKGSCLLDVGINYTAQGTVVGDVDWEGVEGNCAYASPVPGGAGPMTVTTLLWNTVVAWKLLRQNTRQRLSAHVTIDDYE